MLFNIISSSSSMRVSFVLYLASFSAAQSTTTTATASAVSAVDSPVVSIIDTGSVVGNRSQYVNSVYSFKNIPFGGDTSGEERWHHPPHPTPWNGTRDATVFGPACPQAGVDYYSEDCLHLNIWTPGTYAQDDFRIVHYGWTKR